MLVLDGLETSVPCISGMFRSKEHQIRSFPLDFLQSRETTVGRADVVIPLRMIRRDLRGPASSSMTRIFAFMVCAIPMGAVPWMGAKSPI